MKKLTLLLLLIMMCLPVFCQEGHLVIVPEPYSTSLEKPLMAFAGDTVIIQCDSLYLVNINRYRLYAAIAKKVEESGPDTGVIDLFQKSLLEQEAAYKSLLTNCRKNEVLTKNLIDETRSSLEKTQKTLGYTQQTLESSINSLSLADDYIKRQKWDTFPQKVAIGVGGAGIGLLIGLLLGTN